MILIGNGIGAFVIRELTIKGINLISKFVYLKNGAMYSIASLGLIMLLESFGTEIPFWLPPLITVFLLSYFASESIKHLKKVEKVV